MVKHTRRPAGIAHLLVLVCKLQKQAKQVSSLEESRGSTSLTDQNKKTRVKKNSMNLHRLYRLMESE